jgi:hypothetical protein
MRTLLEIMLKKFPTVNFVRNLCHSPNKLGLESEWDYKKV